jgi:hypothetical protein
MMPRVGFELVRRMLDGADPEGSPLRDALARLTRVQGRVRAGEPADADLDEPVAHPSDERAARMVGAFLRETRSFADTPFRLPWQLKPAEYESGRSILGAEPALQTAVAVEALARLTGRGPGGSARLLENWRLKPLLVHLLRRRLPFTAGQIETMLGCLASLSGDAVLGEPLPIGSVLRAVTSYRRDQALSPAMRRSLHALRDRLRELHSIWYAPADSRKALETIERLLGGQAGRPAGDAARVQIDEQCDWGHAAAAALAVLPADEREPWTALLAHAATATASRPTRPWQARGAELVAALGDERFVARVTEWLGLLRAPGLGATRPGADGLAVPTALVAERNSTLLRGLVWCCARFADDALARAVGDAAERCFHKIPWIGARSTRAGNACVWALGAMPGMAGVSQLQRLATRVKQPSARQMIESTLVDAAARAGLAPDDLAELTVPTFDLVEGVRRVAIAGATAEVAVVSAQRVGVRWLGQEGSPLRAEPAGVKRDAPAERAAVMAEIDDLRRSLTAQRERVERLLLDGREWPAAVWRERYLDHPLLSVLARRLIWSFDDGERRVLSAWHAGALADVEGQPISTSSETVRVRLWHPIDTDAGTVRAWQRRLEEYGITQPFKQAHRELYVLTDAERETATYSNRFAGHVLRQHQFRALCVQRGWRYQLQGAFDGANTPTLVLPRLGLTVEFFVENDDGDEHLTEAGISRFIATDQVRFTRGGEVVRLAEIPPVVFSEVMRDVDLFVGVCSVGTDPNWADHGPRRYERYWQDFAFGELSVSATTRRALLERLLPRLAIAGRCELTDRFLVVRGGLRTYKIHLGSGNILMEPDNQYLCIVPGRGGPDAGDAIALPFEGDVMLSVILSKALLLAADTRITDPTIRRQIAPR